MRRNNRTRAGKSPPVASVKRTSEPENIADDVDKILQLIDSQTMIPEGTSSLMLVDQKELDDIGVTIDNSFSEDEDRNGVVPEPMEIDSEVVDISSENDQILDNVTPAKIPKRDVRGRGRIMDPIWKEFQRCPSLPMTQVKCNICGKAVSNKVERLRSHKENYCKANFVSRRQSVPKINNTAKPRKITAYVDTISKQEQEKLSLEVGKYIFATNIPFSHVENPAFLHFMKTLRPAFQLPSRKVVGGAILDRIYRDVIEKQENELHGKDVTIMQDGWKSRVSEPIISHSVTTGDKSYFLNAMSAEENKKTARFCAELLEENIQKLKDVGANVVAVVTDNCASMEKMRRLIATKYPSLYVYGCHPHLLNLVGKKFTDHDILDNVQHVHTFFRTHDAASAILKKSKGARPVLPCETRWNAWIDCLSYYLINQTKLLQISRNPQANVPESVLNILNDATFYKKVEQLVKTLKPIQVALDQLQAENATLADGVKAWIKLKADLVTEDIALHNYFNKQYDRALQPVAIGAYMIHPKYRGEQLQPELIQIGNQFLSSFKSHYIILASQLRQKDEQLFSPVLFSDELLNKTPPIAWWKSLECLEKIDRRAIDFVCTLLKLPAGAADIERHFSILGNIMSVRRARLGIDKASKLCIIYKHLAGRTAPTDDGIDWDINDIIA